MLETDIRLYRKDCACSAIDCHGIAGDSTGSLNGFLNLLGNGAEDLIAKVLVNIDDSDLKN